MSMFTKHTTLILYTDSSAHLIFLHCSIIDARERVSSLNDSGREVHTCELQPRAGVLATNQSRLCVWVTWTNGHKQETQFH